MVRAVLSVVVVAGVLVMASGCGGALNEIKRASESCCAFVGIGIAVIAVGIFALGILSDIRENRLRWEDDAPETYETHAREISTFLPQCREILFEEFAANKQILSSSPFARARRKCLRDAREALRTVEFLYEQEPSRDRYRAVKELTRIRECCKRCKTLNGSRHDSPICCALHQDREIYIDISFQNREEDDG